MNKTELLLPCGNIEMATAAIHNGADAIYVGMPGFNARGRSHDHSLEELKDIIELCHLYDVHVHVAFNILIFQNELEKATSVLLRVLELAPDALIVQDIGIIKLIKEIAPTQIIHGSTQMTVTNHEAISLLDDLDIKRFVLGRENSLAEIKNIKEKTDKELEVFVHGALCVAYSGQCFTSESLGGRSANRGQCAQSCRFEYDLYVDGKKEELKDLKYLVSPKDLCGINEIPELIKLGVESFKVEGRLKSPSFVASVAKSYREAIDTQKVDSNNVDEMALTFSRGFYNGWLGGVAHQNLVDGSFGANRGLEVGVVVKVLKNSLLIESRKSIELGDGLFVAGENKSFGGNVYSVSQKRGLFEVGFQKKLSLNDIEVSSRVFINNRDSLSKDLTKTYTAKDNLKRLPIQINVKISIGDKISLDVLCGNIGFSLYSETEVEEAKSGGISESDVLKSIGGLSHSPYIIGESNIGIVGNLFVHNKVLKLLKQEMVTKLNELRLNRDNKIEKTPSLPAKFASAQSESKLSILIREFAQLEPLVKYLNESNMTNLLKFVILDYEFGKDFVKSVRILKESKIPCLIATTRILKPNEYHNFTLIKRASPDGILVRNLGALNYFQNSEFSLHGDFSLNITNSKSFEYLKSKGLKSLCLSYDLNLEHLNNLLDCVDTSFCEVTAHQYMPEFHMEHCVFAAFLSEGNSFRDCGKPCEKHKVHLTDMFGNTHEIKADQECRNTMFSANAMSAVKFMPGWMEKGVGSFRFEALHETGEELVKKISYYFEVLNGEFDTTKTIMALGSLESYGVNTGQLLKTKKYQDRKKNV